MPGPGHPTCGTTTFARHSTSPSRRPPPGRSSGRRGLCRLRSNRLSSLSNSGCRHRCSVGCGGSSTPTTSSVAKSPSSPDRDRSTRSGSSGCAVSPAGSNAWDSWSSGASKRRSTATSNANWRGNGAVVPRPKNGRSAPTSTSPCWASASQSVEKEADRYRRQQSAESEEIAQLRNTIGDLRKQVRDASRARRQPAAQSRADRVGT